MQIFFGQIFYVWSVFQKKNVLFLWFICFVFICMVLMSADTYK